MRDLSLFARSWDPETFSEKTPLVLIHDSLGCGDLWREFPALLCTALNRKIIAYDRWGFGRSDVRQELLPLNFIEEELLTIQAILSFFKLKKVSLWGHSVGGAMAIVFGANHPLLCEFLVSESAQTFVENKTLEGIRAAQESFRDARKFEKLKKYHGEKAEWVLRSWTETWLNPDFLNWNLKGFIPKLKNPLLVLHGEDDEYASLKHPEMMSELSTAITKKVIIDNCAHVPHRENPQEVIRHLNSFLLSLSL